MSVFRKPTLVKLKPRLCLWGKCHDPWYTEWLKPQFLKMASDFGSIRFAWPGWDTWGPVFTCRSHSFSWSCAYSAVLKIRPKAGKGGHPILRLSKSVVALTFQNKWVVQDHTAHQKQNQKTEPKTPNPLRYIAALYLVLMYMWRSQIWQKRGMEGRSISPRTVKALFPMNRKDVTLGQLETPEANEGLPVTFKSPSSGRRRNKVQQGEKASPGWKALSPPYRENI